MYVKVKYLWLKLNPGAAKYKVTARFQVFIFMRLEKGDYSAQVQVASRVVGFFAAGHIELAVDTFDLRFNGVDGDDQFLGNLRVG